ncbi:uncharacterized protein LOC131605496 [Vicia villosa]|uniref:uncharacterized protein LOC131605496 n=1 Tax=Vicia villosa TaxID=3911 RepID=UPI00273CAD8C|nr:uncharacterized protein LOC131605496 [Vicia villosa]
MHWEPKPTSSWILKNIAKVRDITMQSEYWNDSVQQSIFNTNAMYKDLRGRHENQSWRKLLIQNYARPRACFTLWLAILNRLPSKDRLLKINIHTDGKCSFCGQSESIEHLFFLCSFTSNIWNHVMAWIGYSRSCKGWEEEKKWLCMETAKKGWRRCLLKLAIAEVVYQVWQMRNDRIFNNKDADGDILHRIKQTIVIRSCAKRVLKNHMVFHILLQKKKLTVFIKFCN